MNMKKNRQALWLPLWLLAGICFALLPRFTWAAQPAEARSATFALDIPSQNLDGALQALALVSRHKLLYPTAVVEGMRSSALKGEFTAEQAVQRLLVGTNLTYEFTADGMVLIREKGAKSSDVGPAGLMRVAAAVENNENDEHKKLSDESAEDRQVVVQGERDRRKPFADANMDLPRTVNDVQPYYIFDAKTIEHSGALNIGDFLKQRLTMNSVAQTNGEMAEVSGTFGNTSTINLRGVGADKTLILVNGRRMAGVNILITEYQPDLNGIPLSAIDRIEVLPSSASGIYGGSAIGGVVNVVLKRDYAGGEVRASYDNTWDADAPRRNASASYGMALEGGKTHLMLNAAWSDGKALLMQDRLSVYRRNLETVQRNQPGYFYSDTSPWLGALPNIIPSSSAVTTLTLKDGPALNSRYTYIPAGTSASTSAAELASGLLANAGQQNFDFPASTQPSTGLLRRFGTTPQTRSWQVGVRRQMLPGLELFVDAAFSENKSSSVYNPITSFLTISADAPTNPFATEVRILVPDSNELPIDTGSQSRSVTVGGLLQLPGNWTAAMDYTWSESRFDYTYYSLDEATRTADLLSGALNPFVDTLRFPLDMSRYLGVIAYNGANRLQDIALRGSGPLPALPWGVPQLTAGLEWRATQTPKRHYQFKLPVTGPYSHGINTYYERESTTQSAYLEASAPLFKAGWLPGIDALDLQVAGRVERFTVDTGTNGSATRPNMSPPSTFYFGTTLNGQPYFSEASYTSSNYTLGVKYRPVRDLSFRVSQASAFIPPTPSQLIKNPLQSTSTTNVDDPRTGQMQVPVYTLSGGNPDLSPQRSRSFNAGIIWEPRWHLLAGLRLNAEYYKIQQFGAIGSLGAQMIVNQEDLYQDRVIRDGSGMITLVDVSAVNLYHRETEGWDLSANYAVNTGVGRFGLQAAGSVILHLKEQYALSLPELEVAGFHPSEANQVGAESAAAKYKANATLNWERGQWAASWTAQYFGSYKMYGAAGGPYSVLNSNGQPYMYFITAQGSDTIPSQTYHNLFVSYTFDLPSSNGYVKSLGANLLSGLTLQFGMRNVFDKVPPLDVYYSSSFYISPYGDARLRSYWLSLRKQF
jgi:outer membrane receptor protein involved in Fe transport